MRWLTIPYVYLAAAVADMCYAELLGGGVELQAGCEFGDPFCEGPVRLCGGEREKTGGDGGGVRTELSVPDDGGVGAVYRDLRHGGGGRHFLLQRSEIIIDAQTVAKWAPG